MASMPNDYHTMRDNFRAAALTAGAELAEYPHPLPGPDSRGIATDVALIGNPQADKLLIINSGTHGVEGAYGSAAQVAWLKQRPQWLLPDNIAVLMIHLINPWGAAWSRRVNEGNVDLNRNFLDWAQRLPQNPEYAALHPGLVFTDLDGADHQRASDDYQAAKARAGGWHMITPIIEAGQYTHPDGLFYGGDAPVWSNLTLQKFCVNLDRMPVKSLPSTCIQAPVLMAIPRCYQSRSRITRVLTGARPCSARLFQSY